MKITDKLKKTVLTTIKENNLLESGDRVLVGLSGGADSMCLLHVLCNLSEKLGIEIAAMHMNHNIRGSEADSDAMAAQSLADSLDIRFFLVSKRVKEYAKENSLSEELAGIKDKLSGVTITDDQIKEILTDLANGYGEYAKANNLAQPDKIQAAFLKYISSDAGQKLLLQYAEKIVDTKTLQANLQNKMASVMGGFTNELTSQISSAMGKVMEQVGTNLQKSMGNAMTSLMGNMQDIFSIDPDAFAKAIQVNMSEDDLQELMTSLMTTGTVSYESNLNKMGYADENDPQTISIYPIDFDSKQVVDQIIEDYNDDMKNSGQEDKVISYTDMVGMMMSSVTSIVNMISYVLIAFVAISLVVSSIMIGVITYISVLERRKEIGILRAIGASKGNVGAVFNAETFIIGLLAGLIGIGLTIIAIFPMNYIIHTVSGNTDVNAALPIGAAFILIALSVVLTLLGGLIPANKASKSDPVTALRTE